MITTKVAIFDKDLLARRALSGILQNESGFKVVGTSGNIERTIELIQNTSVDVLLFNIDRLDSNDFSSFLTIRAHFSDLPIVILAKRNDEGAEAVIAALKMGAVDVITKPEACTGLLFAGNHLAKRVVPIVKNAGSTKQVIYSKILSRYSRQPYQHRFGSVIPDFGEAEVDKGAQILVVGACSGGPVSLFSIIPELPEELSIPAVVVQHFPKKYTAVLARELNKQSDIEVREAFDGAEMVPGMVWIAPGGSHCEIHRAGSHHTMLRVHEGPRELGNRPSINVLFRSASSVYGTGVLGVILSGYGKDGLEGAKTIVNSGGQILVVNPETAVAAELPLSVIESGCADQYYDLEDLVAQIQKRIRSKSKKHNETSGFLN